MRVLVAGATGAVGSRLVPLLVSAGHDVTGTARSEARLGPVRAAGAEGAVMDGLVPASVRDVVAAAAPDVVVHQLTALSSITGDFRRFDEDFAVTNRLRTEGTDALLGAALAAGTRRFVAQSYTGWPNERRGARVKTEDDPLTDDPGKEAVRSLRAIEHVERAVTGTPGIEGFVLRYGAFYGPGQALSRTGAVADLIRRGRFPVVGGGTGMWSFMHVDDAATAAAAAVDRGVPGVYNIVDDDPAPVSEWLPYLAEQLGGRRPMRLPAWLARPMLGQLGVAMMTAVRASSNAKARRELAWEPRFASWREGFRTGLG
ncbi:NAD-dependent epimerase/dehydratase family protein [Krasilnikoviella flava]|uniref:Nucleoside-diphosphate-sugar epimerase n=1 Tax=Krasilnikoviella flava TaxID=526729 RepID=A0A1T5IJZ5_9MICO|nr:NAD(P)-dependent oxidoreductase [Krasilnikoviella flava]SKC39491.1 Nucleoside-diphosphate-sugar epimerase [Krasilnikoviella flava]